MALALLKHKTEKEGFLKKTASGKGKDEVRGKWQERWFVLKGHNLDYFKNQADSTPKGTVDLRAAKIDDADEKTGKPFTIRVAQSKQVFVYLQGSSQADKDAWLLALRKCAGYKLDDPVSASGAPKLQEDSFCCFGALFKQSVTNAEFDEIVIVFDMNDHTVKLFDDGKLVKAHAAKTVTNVNYSQFPDCKAPNQQVSTLFSLTVDFKSDSYMTRRALFVGSLEEAQAVAALLSAVGQNNFQPVSVILKRPVIHSGFLQVRDDEDESKWSDSWLVLLEQRCLVMPARDAPVPSSVLWIQNCQVRTDGKVGLVVKASLRTVTLRCNDAGTRDIWINAFKTASTSLKDQIDSALSRSLEDVKVSSPFSAVTSPTLQRIPSGVGAGAGGNAVAASPSNATMTGLALHRIPSGVSSTSNSSTSPLNSPSSMRGIPSPSSPLIAPMAPMALATSAGGATGAGGVSVSAGVATPQIALRNAFAAQIEDQAETWLVTWGLSSGGQLGHRSKDSVYVPKVVDPLRGKRIRYIAAAGSGTHCAAVTELGHVYVWGEGPDFQLGLGEGRTQSSSPYLVTSLRNVGVVQVACGRSHTMALAASGLVYTWGSSKFGQLGRGSTKSEAYPQPIESLSGRQVQHITAGGDHSACISGLNELWVWGGNSEGQLGLGHRNDVIIPTYHEPLNLKGAVFTAECGLDFTAALLVTGHLYTWGNNTAGKLGLGHSNAVALPAQVESLAPHMVTHISAGSHHMSVVVNTDDEHGVVYSWGKAPYSGHSQDYNMPHRWNLSDDLKRHIAPIRHISSSETHTLVTDDTLSLVAFGSNSFGEFGNGRIHTGGVTRVMMGAKTQVIQSACGAGFSMALVAGAPPTDFSSDSSSDQKYDGSASSPRPQMAFTAQELQSGQITEQSAQAKIGALLQSANVAVSAVEVPPSSSAAPPVVDASVSPREAEPVSPRDDDGGGKKKKKRKPLWKEVQDPNTGRSYFYNTKTRETRWKRPPEMDDPEQNTTD